MVLNSLNSTEILNLILKLYRKRIINYIVNMKGIMNLIILI